MSEVKINLAIMAAIGEMLAKLADSPENFSYFELMSALVGEGAREMPIEKFLEGAAEIARFEYARGITRSDYDQVQKGKSVPA